MSVTPRLPPPGEEGETTWEEKTKQKTVETPRPKAPAYHAYEERDARSLHTLHAALVER